MPLQRIALLSYHTCPLALQEGKETGGMNIYVLELAKELAKGGLKIDIFTRSQATDNPFIVQVEPNLRVIHLPAGPQASVPKKELLKYIDEFVAQLLAFANNESINYELLYAHYYMSGLAAIKAQALIKTETGIKLPIVFTFHTLALMKNLVARTESELESNERIEIEFTLARQVDKIIAASINDAQYLHYLYEVPHKRIAVIPPGVNTKLFLPIDQLEAKKHIGADPDHKLILFVGRIEPLKGLDGLLYAIKILLNKTPPHPVCLWIVGGDINSHPSEWSAELKKLKELRHLLNIPTSVRFAGQQTQEELVYYYNAAEVAVMPSHYESFGMAAAEAMACGTPVITSNVAGISQLLDEKHKPLLTTVSNPLLLADQIEHVLTHRTSHEEAASELRQKVQDLAWPQIAERILRVLIEA